MSNIPTNERAFLGLIECLLRSKHQIFELGNAHGLNGMQTMTLLQLNEPRSMHEFKTIYNCDPSNVTTIVDALEERKLVERYTSPVDRRIKMVKLLSKGVKLRRSLITDLTNSDDYFLAKLSPAEAATFAQLVQKIILEP
jgi:DNA-binding MarR family transcriptional regulator